MGTFSLITMSLSSSIFVSVLAILAWVALHSSAKAMRNTHQAFDSNQGEDAFQEFRSSPGDYARLNSLLYGETYATPSKRYLGIEIPDFVSLPGRGQSLKSLSSWMQEAGKK